MLAVFSGLMCCRQYGAAVLVQRSAKLCKKPVLVNPKMTLSPVDSGTSPFIQNEDDRKIPAVPAYTKYHENYLF